jgi:glutaminyl-peptide cyclotransferase
MKRGIDMQNLLTWSLIFILLLSCAEAPRNSSSRPDPDRSATQGPASRLSGTLIYPETGTVFITGEDIKISLSHSIIMIRWLLPQCLQLMGGKLSLPERSRVNLYGIQPEPRLVPEISSLIIGFDDQSSETYSLQITLHSDIVPEVYSFRIVNSFPHDIRAFTQGLVYDNGFLYESTGQYGQSTLRKVDLETGQVLRSLSLDRELFGEGLCVHEGKLYQLTWKSRVGFIYDKETFRVLNRVYYDTEGWGLTSDGTNLLKVTDPIISTFSIRNIFQKQEGLRCLIITVRSTTLMNLNSGMD